MFKFFKKKYTPAEFRFFNFLRKNRLFEKLTDDELSHFTPYLYSRNYRQNEVVFFTGDPSQALYIVKTGIVSLNLDLRNDFEKLMTLRSGRLFGYNTLLVNTKRLYTSIVLTEESELYVLPKVNVMEIMDEHPAIRAKVMTAFSETYNEYMNNLFKTYKSSLGFFDLGAVYDDINL